MGCRGEGRELTQAQPTLHSLVPEAPQPAIRSWAMSSSTLCSTQSLSPPNDDHRWECGGKRGGSAAYHITPARRGVTVAAAEVGWQCAGRHLSLLQHDFGNPDRICPSVDSRTVQWWHITWGSLCCAASPPRQLPLVLVVPVRREGHTRTSTGPHTHTHQHTHVSKTCAQVHRLRLMKGSKSAGTRW